MPIYEYRCQSCGHEFEKMVRMSQRDTAGACPQCAAKSVERKVSVFAAQQAAAEPSPPPGCGRCGGPGPCAAGNW